MYKIRLGKRLKLKDIDEIHTLLGWGTYTPEQWNSIKKNSNFFVQVVYNKKIIAFVRCVSDPRFCMIYDVSVHPEFQKKGVGRLLMQEILKYVKTQDFYAVSLFYDPKKPTLKEFYQKFGFEPFPTALRLKI